MSITVRDETTVKVEGYVITHGRAKVIARLSTVGDGWMVHEERSSGAVGPLAFTDAEDLVAFCQAIAERAHKVIVLERASRAARDAFEEWMHLLPGAQSMAAKAMETL